MGSARSLGQFGFLERAALGAGCVALSIVASCGNDGDTTASSSNYVCARELNTCECGDPGKIVLSTDRVSECPGSVPEGPYRCCRGAESCRCEPYVCIGGAIDQCICNYTTNPLRPSRCLTVAAKAASGSSDPGIGDTCCAAIDSESGNCLCSYEACSAGRVQVTECSPETAIAVCPAGTTEVTSCAD